MRSNIGSGSDATSQGDWTSTIPWFGVYSRELSRKDSRIGRRPKKKGITITDPNSAPIIFFDGAANSGCSHGIVTVTLAVTRNLTQNNSVASDAVAIACLRCSVTAAIELRRALDQAILIATTAGKDGKAN